MVASAAIFWEKSKNQLPLGEITESHFMSLFTDCPAEVEKIWASPTFEVIPISFEASSYAFTDDDDRVVR